MMCKLSINRFGSLFIGSYSIFQVNKAANKYRFISDSNLRSKTFFMPMYTLDAELIVSVMRTIGCIVRFCRQPKILSAVVMATTVYMINAYVTRNIFPENSRHDDSVHAEFSAVIDNPFIPIKLTDPITVVGRPAMFGKQIFVDFVNQYFHEKSSSTLAALGQGGFAWHI